MLTSAPSATSSVIWHSAVPMLTFISEDSSFPDTALARDMMGFALVGQLHPVKYSCQHRASKVKGEPFGLPILDSRGRN